MATRVIKLGDNLSTIGASYGVTADDLMKLNVGNPSVKTKEVIISGGNLNVPDAPSGTPPIASTQSNVGTAGAKVETPPIIPGSTVPSNAVPQNDMTASFATFGGELANIGKDLSALSASSATQLTAEEKQAQLATHERSDESIRRGYELSREEAAGNIKTGQQEQSRARELLGMSPAVIKGNVEKYTLASEEFVKSSNRSIERLHLDEQTALESGDYKFAEQLRADRKEAETQQRQMIMDRFNFLTQSYNAMLSGAQFQQKAKADKVKEATDRVNLTLPTIAGKKFESLPLEVQTQLRMDADAMGIDLSVLKDIASIPEVKFQVVRGNTMYAFDAAANLIRSESLGGENGPGGPVIDYLKAYISGDIAGPAGVKDDYRDEFLSILNEKKSEAIGNEVFIARDSIGTLSDIESLSGTPELAQESIIDSVTTKILSSPSGVYKILGGDYSIDSVVNEDQKTKIRQIVEKYVEELVPLDFITKRFVKIKSPIFSVPTPEVEL